MKDEKLHIGISNDKDNFYIDINKEVNSVELNNVIENKTISGIDVALAKRYDILNKMVEVVKRYAKYEKEVLFKVVNLENNMSIKDRIDENNKMSDNINMIATLVEAYPDIKADKNYIELQHTIFDVEEHLQGARKAYNANVSLYNNVVLSFPSNIIASLFKFDKKRILSG